MTVKDFFVDEFENRVSLVSDYIKKEENNKVTLYSRKYVYDKEAQIKGNDITIEKLSFISNITIEFNININKKVTSIKVNNTNKVMFDNITSKKESIQLKNNTKSFIYKEDFELKDIKEFKKENMDVLINNTCKNLLEFEGYIQEHFDCDFF